MVLLPPAEKVMPCGSVPIVDKEIAPLVAVRAMLPLLAIKGVTTEVPAVRVLVTATPVKAPVERVVAPIGMPSRLPPVSTALFDRNTPSAVRTARTRPPVTKRRSMASFVPR